jgi:hypothetical protein
MKISHTVCKKIKCSHLNEEEKRCTFDDCIFSTAEIKIKEELIDDKEFYFFLIKFAGTIALVFLMTLILMKAGELI